jgi:hypothetical protein
MPKEIILHWTAGTYKCCDADKEHYHFIIDGDGKTIEGKYSIQDNENCKDGKYAQHTAQSNTGAIGIACCGMYEYIGRDRIGRYPLKRIQIERMCELAGKLAKKYNIPIEMEFIHTHYEEGLMHPETSNRYKSDINFLPYDKKIPAGQVGDYLRQKILWYYKYGTD